MLVTQQNIGQVIQDLLLSIENALDTEAFGLLYNDDLFSLQIATEKMSYYFNFLDYKGTIPVLDKQSTFKLLQEKVFSMPDKLWFIHNAKFDMRKLAMNGCALIGSVWDTQTMERFVRNNYMKYSLAECAKRRGWAKGDKVEEHIKAHPRECTTSIQLPGKKKKEKLKHYDKVPFPIMYEYGLIDARICYKIGKDQQAYFNKNPDLLPIVENEKKLTKAIFNMESNGILMDRNLCAKLRGQEQAVVEKLYTELEQMVGLPYKSGPKWLTKALDDQEIEYARNDKGNPVFDKQALKSMDNHITNKILEIRHYETRVRSFYTAYLYFSDNAGVLHPNFNIGGTDTGRFSGSEPNMQQVPKEEGVDSDDTVRQIFKPRPGFIYVMMDYDTMEYRLAADYAGELEMISAIKGGLDPHTFVAKMMGVERKPAKTLNFQNLYGGGVAKLCSTLFNPISKLETLKLICRRYLWKSKRLKVDEIAKLSRIPAEVIQHDVEELKKAEALQDKYFKTLPKLEKLFENVEDTATKRGFIRNRYGRRVYLDNKSQAYKLVNYLIQGCGADIIRHAIVKLDELLADKKSNMLLQVHDEILFEIHKSELDIIPQLRAIMEDEYKPINGMNLTVGVEWSTKSWAQADKRDGVPTEEMLSEVV